MIQATSPHSFRPVLEIEGVQRHFGEPELVLDDVHLRMEPGEVVGLLGKNGAGKTTLIRMVLGMVHPHAGSVKVFGLSPQDDPVAVKQRIGYVSDAQVLPPYLRARDVFEMHAGLFPTWDPKLAQSLKERFEISGTKKIRDMSKGEARRVAVACAIAHRPQLLLLDEPSSGFDPAARREFLEIALEHLNGTGSSILFSSHQLDDVERLASRIAFLHGSRMVLDEPLVELQEAFSLVLGEGGADHVLALRTLKSCVTARVAGDQVHALFRSSGEDALAAATSVSEGARFASRRPRLEDVFIELVESRVQPREIR